MRANVGVVIPLCLLINVCGHCQRKHKTEHYAFRCPLLHVSAVVGHYEVDFAAACMENNTDVETSPSQLINRNT
jgi:hypothetical protein